MEQQTTDTWVEHLLVEVKNFDASLFPPTGPISKGETILGDCPENAKPYFALAQYYLRECKRIKLEAEFVAQDRPDEQAQYWKMDQKHDALMEMFWGMAKDGLDLWTVVGAIGVRKDWKIVKAKEKAQEIIAGILGLGG